MGGGGEEEGEAVEEEAGVLPGEAGSGELPEEGASGGLPGVEVVSEGVPEAVASVEEEEARSSASYLSLVKCWSTSPAFMLVFFQPPR